MKSSLALVFLSGCAVAMGADMSLDTFAVTPNDANVTSGPDTVTCDITVTESGAFDVLDAGCVFVSPSGYRASCIAHSHIADVWSCDVTFLEDTEDGAWTVEYVFARNTDTPPSQVRATYAEMVADIPNVIPDEAELTVTVTSPTEDVTAPTIDTFTALPATADPGGTVTCTQTITETGSGLRDTGCTFGAASEPNDVTCIGHGVLTCDLDIPGGADAGVTWNEVNHFARDNALNVTVANDSQSFDVSGTGGAGGAGGVGGVPTVDFTFTREAAISTTAVNPWGKSIGDINSDGLVDLIYGAQSTGGLYWNENTGSGWTERTVAASGAFETDHESCDVDLDGDIDILTIRSGAVYVYKNTNGIGTTWDGGTLVADETSTEDIHDIEMLDFDLDGACDLAARGQHAFGANGLALYTYVNNGSGSFSATTPSSYTIIAGEGLDSADLDGDGFVDIITNEQWHQNDQDETFTIRRFVTDWSSTPGDKDTFITHGDFDRDGDIDIAMSPSELVGGTGREVAWFENPGDPTSSTNWTKRTVEGSVESAMHSLRAADFDLDGDMDLVGAEMGNSDNNSPVTAYRNDGATWTAFVIEADLGSHSQRILDWNLDGLPDFFGANFSPSGSDSSDTIWLWTNTTTPSTLALDSWTRHVIDASSTGNRIFIGAGDLNGDQLPDIIAGAYWYPNPGSPGGTWTQTAIGTNLNNYAVLKDYDNDGDLDVLGTDGVAAESAPTMIYGENNGSGSFTINSSVGEGNGDFLQGRVAQRITPGDEIRTFLSWHDSASMEYVQAGADPGSGSWTFTDMTVPGQDEDLSSGDIDRDGDLDISTGTQWLDNEGDPGSQPTWTTDWDIESPLGTPDRNVLADMNQDGRLDVVVGYEAISTDGLLAWYAAPPDPTGTWTETVIASVATGDLIGPMSLDVADMDRDGDLDVIVGEHNLASPSSARLFIYENTNPTVGDTWSRHLVYTGDEHHDGAQVVDIDNDGDLDIISVGWGHTNVVLYENTATSAGELIVDLNIDDPDNFGATFDEGVPVEATADTALTVDIMARSMDPTGSPGLGIGDGAITTWDSMPARIRFNNTGLIEVNINGSTYGCETTCPIWTANTWYHFRFIIDIDLDTYDVLVDEYDGSPPTNLIADDRALQPTATSLDRWGGWAENTGVIHIHHSVQGTWETTCDPVSDCNSGQWVCGDPPDGCGGEQSCGTCSEPDPSCTDAFICCDPDEASVECTGLDCGLFPDTCDGTYDCDAELGTCDSRTSGDVCFANACCTPRGAAWCTTETNECGLWDDTCGDQVNCGTCDPGFSCSSGTCVESGGSYDSPEDIDYDHVIVLSSNTTASAITSTINGLGAGTVLVRSDATRRTVTGSTSVPRDDVTYFDMNFVATSTSFWYPNNGTVFYDITADPFAFNVEGKDNWRMLFSYFSGGFGTGTYFFQNQINNGGGQKSNNWEIAFNTFTGYYQVGDFHSEGLWIGGGEDGWIHDNLFTDEGTTGHIFLTWSGLLFPPTISTWSDNICIELNVFTEVSGEHGQDIQGRSELAGLVTHYIDPTQPSDSPYGGGFVYHVTSWDAACAPGSGGSFRP